MSSQDRYLAPVLAAVLLHGAAAAALQIADERGADGWDDETEVSVEPAAEKEKEPEKEVEPEPEPEPEQAVTPLIEQKVVKQVQARVTTPVITPDAEDLEATGGNNDGPAPGGIFKMDDVVPGGTAMGGVGGGKYTGKGGAGAGSGSGEGAGSGDGPPAPVSIASIKKRAMPINNSDLVDKLANKVTGDVVLKLVISDKGAVVKATLIKRLTPSADAKALALARELRFTPAIDTNDKPVASVVSWTCTFRPPS